MSTIWGIVKDGLVVPQAPLPEGATVEIRVCDAAVPADLQAELDAWQRSSAEALDLVERLAKEGATDETR